MIHWTWIVFGIIIIILISAITKTSNEAGGDYSFDIITPILIIILIAFVLIWGGIFWW